MKEQAEGGRRRRLRETGKKLAGTTHAHAEAERNIKSAAVHEKKQPQISQIFTDDSTAVILRAKPEESQT